LTSPEAQRRRHRRLVLCLVIAALVRLAALYQFSEVERFHGDEAYYQKTARSILAGDGHPGSHRPPLYPAFVAAVYAVSGENPLTLRLVQIGVSLLAVFVVFRIVTARFGERAATYSALTCALVPSLVHYTHFLWSECLAATLLILFVWALDLYDRTERTGLMALAGACLGLNALVRETWAFFGVVVLLGVLWRHRANWRKAMAPAAAFAGCLVLVLTPWAVRNYRVHDSFVLVATGHWLPLAQGNLFDQDDWLLGVVKTNEERRELRGASDAEREAYWKTVTLDAVRAEQPWWIFKKTIRNTGLLFSVRGQAVRFIWRGWIDLPPWQAYAVIATSVAGHLLAMGLAIAALWLVRGGWLKPVVVVTVLYTIGIHVIANATSRYLVPLMPLLALFVGPLLAKREWVVSRPRLVGAALTLAGFAVVVALRWNYALQPALDVIAGGGGAAVGGP